MPQLENLARAGVNDIVTAARKARAEALGEDYIEEQEVPENEELPAEEPSEPEQDPDPESEEIQEDSELSEDSEVKTGREEPNTEEEEEETVTIKVDGVEKQVPVSKVYDVGVRSLQKQEAADKRLEEANKKIQEAQLYEQRVRAQVEAQLRSAKQEAQNMPLSPRQDADVRGQAKKIIDKILDGDEEEAADALAEAMGRQQTGPIPLTTEQIANKAAQQVQSRLEGQEAVKAFRETYPNLAGDNRLWNMVDQETVQVRAENPQMGIKEVILESGRRVQELLQGFATESGEEKVEVSRARKVAAKRTKEPLKTAKTRQAPKPEYVPPTRSDVVAEMRKKRGLPNY